MSTRRKKGSPDLDRFGDRLQYARRQRGLTQRQAAEALGLSQSTVSEAEIEAKGSSHVVAFAKLYQCDPYWLALGESDGEPYPAARQYSVQAAELARAFDLMPDRTQPEQELKRRLYLSILQMLAGASQAIAQTLQPAAEPTRAPAQVR